MRAVGIKVLNSRLSKYIRLAAAGEIVLVTDRERVVAEIGPPRPGRSPDLADAQLAELVRRGVLRPPILPPDAPLPETKGVAALEDVLAELDADRADG